MRYLPFFLLSSLLCCQTPAPAPATAPVLVRLPTAGFVAIWSGQTGPVERLTCPGAAGPLLSCDAAGVRVQPSAITGDLTVKIRGSKFSSKHVDAGEMGGTLDLELPVLANFEVTSDYVTGFTTDGLVAFQDLAVQVPTELGPSWAVKFYLSDVQGTPKVWFQNTKKHLLHYGFAQKVLGVVGTVHDFEQNTYHGAKRTAMAGTLVYYPEVTAKSVSLTGQAVAPVTLTFFPSDDLTPAQVRLAHRLLEERLGFVPLTGGKQRLAYLPAGSAQETQLLTSSKDFAAQDAAWLTRAELYGGLTLQILNPGVAFGTLKRLTPEALGKTILASTDILVLTRLPNEMPVIGGSITEELQTPLAHVNVAARTRGTPNMALLHAGDDARVQPWLGKLVRFEVGNGGFTLGAATLAEAEAFWLAHKKQPYLPKSDDAREGLPGFKELHFKDSLSVGVKAANLAELSQLLADQVPGGFAIPFHYYQAFMQSTTATHATCEAARADCPTESRPVAVCDAAQKLCDPGAKSTESLWQLATRLIANPEFKLDAPLREAVLTSLQWHIRHGVVDPAFAQLLTDRVQKQFGGAKVRMRSSTNAEDLPDFSGAGLYTSVSATATGSKAASSQVREVWASVWSWRAFEERTFWQVDHLNIRMGMAVTDSFPDEQANGVLITQNIADPNVIGMYLNVQKGEVSVTNPEDGAVPEVLSIIPSPTGVQVARQRFSSLSPDTPLLSDGEIAQLYLAASQVQSHFAPLYGKDPEVLALDIEFKFHGPGRKLIFKQVRPYTPAKQ